MTPLTDIDDLSDAIASIEVSTKILEHHGSNPHPRLVSWAIAALQREGANPESLAEIVQGKEPHQQWRSLRVFLSPAALLALQGHLSRATEQQRKPGHQKKGGERND